MEPLNFGQYCKTGLYGIVGLMCFATVIEFSIFHMHKRVYVLSRKNLLRSVERVLTGASGQ
jgi:hypothetical protein